MVQANDRVCGCKSVRKRPCLPPSDSLAFAQRLAHANSPGLLTFPPYARIFAALAPVPEQFFAAKGAPQHKGDAQHRAGIDELMDAL